MTYAFSVLGVLMFVISIFLPSSLKEEMAENKAKNTAINFLLYRNAVHTYLFVQDNFTGSVQDINIKLPTGFIKKDWSARVQNNICYVYGITSKEEINAVRKLLLGSHSIGEKRNGIFYPQYSDSSLVLPSFIPEKALLSIMELK